MTYRSHCEGVARRARQPKAVPKCDRLEGPMSTCKTCKHWVPFDERNVEYEYGDGPEYAVTERNPESVTKEDRREPAANVKRLGLCRMASNDEHQVESLALAVDGSDYRYDLRTAAEFGCVQWGAKP